LTPSDAAAISLSRIARHARLNFVCSSSQPSTKRIAAVIHVTA